MIPICARIDADDPRTLDALTGDGWREVEVLETYRGKPAGRQHDFIRRAIMTDLTPCMHIAEMAFKHDRLHADPQVPPDVATNAKREWVRQDFHDKQIIVYVYSLCGGVVGFCAVKFIGDGLTIDLIATLLPRKRICTRLVEHIMADLNPAYLRAGTQLSNQEGRLFYAALGMTCIKRQRTLHKP